MVRGAGPLLRLLLKALVQLELSIPELLLCLQAFREGVHRGLGTSGAMHARLLMQAMLHRTIRSELVESVLTRLEASKRPHAVLLEDLARELNRDPTVLGRRVVQETGVGYREWRAGYVIRRAVRALALGRVSISEIAWDVGFEHLSGFDRYFHTMLEVTPSEFRHLCELFGIVHPDFDRFRPRG
jgi:AraC-like DNA-binding protein